MLCQSCFVKASVSPITKYSLVYVSCSRLTYVHTAKYICSYQVLMNQLQELKNKNTFAALIFDTQLAFNGYIVMEMTYVHNM